MCHVARDQRSMVVPRGRRKNALAPRLISPLRQDRMPCLRPPRPRVGEGCMNASLADGPDQRPSSAPASGESARPAISRANCRENLSDPRGAGQTRRHLGPVPVPRRPAPIRTFPPTPTPFKPWKSRKRFAGADEILAYLREAAAEHGVDRKIRYRCKAMAADWDSASALWRVTVRSADVGSETTVRCRWLFVATGYYDYERGHRPHFPDEEAFRGPILHPQAWPEGFDAKGKRIAVIGSGATADDAGSGARRGRGADDANPAHAELHPAVPFGGIRSPTRCGGLCPRRPPMRSRGARTSCFSNGSTRFSSAIPKPRGASSAGRTAGCCPRATPSTSTSTRLTTRGTSGSASRPMATS